MKRISYGAVILLVIVCLTSCLKPHDAEEKTPAPGYRPESDHSAVFLSSVGTCRIAVYPTIVRTKSTGSDGFVMGCNKASQQTILKHLIKKDIADPDGCMTELDLSRAGGKAQWGFFISSMKLMGEQIKHSNMETDYHLAVEVLIIPRPNNRLAVFGIHVYVLDQSGHNAFSFLLNSHHQLFVDAELNAEDTSREATETLVANSTRVALQALDQQIQPAK